MHKKTPAKTQGNPSRKREGLRGRYRHVVKPLFRMGPALGAFSRYQQAGPFIRQSQTVKNAIHAAKTEFSKVKYLKNLFQYYTVIPRIRVLPGQVAL
ncbi:hypothetical protein [Pantoea coffeiphila]|uniref:hypothetical protein n=1 Tax=Pantoea coffeiphila TaxID=1465635 RepID=UPI0011B073E6|nr:hypothetical protein [Pantoea coffeiphila]